MIFKLTQAESLKRYPAFIKDLPPVIEIYTIQELLALMEKYKQSIILYRPEDSYDSRFEICIYNDYVE
jgi:hypothetical protein